MHIIFFQPYFVTIFCSIYFTVAVASDVSHPYTKLNIIQECMDELKLEGSYVKLDTTSLIALVDKLESKYATTINTLESKYVTTINTLELKYATTINTLELNNAINYSNTIKDYRINYINTIKDYNINYTNTINDCTINYTNTIHHCTTQIKTLTLSTIFFQTLVGMRNVIEDLEDQLYPLNFPSTNEKRYLRWIIILKISEAKEACFLRHLIQKHGLEMEEFAKMVTDYYSEKPSVIHNFRGIPDCSQAEMENALKQYGGLLHPDAHDIIKVLFEEFNTPSPIRRQVTCSEDLKTYRCIRLTIAKIDATSTAEIPNMEIGANVTGVPKSEIAAFFHQKQAKEAIVTTCKIKNVYVTHPKTNTAYIVKFAAPINAAAGILENSGFVDGFSVDPTLISCNLMNEECESETMD